MASGPISSRQIEGGKVEAVTDFIFLSSKITEDNNCSHEIKIRLLLGRTAMTNLDSTLKSRDITFQQRSLRSIKGPYVQPKVLMVFPVVMYRCESWTIKKAENWRIDAFDLWYWRRLLRVPWTARRACAYTATDKQTCLFLPWKLFLLPVPAFGGVKLYYLVVDTDGVYRS